MSQREVFKVLKELGGRATTKEIKETIRSKFPDTTLYLYVTNRLKKLERKGFVRRVIKDDVYWEITKEYI